MLEKIDFEDEIAHLFVVDIMLDLKNTTKRRLVDNEIYSPIIEKKKIIHYCERSVCQLLEQYKEGDNDKPLAYCATSKAPTTMLKKKINSNVFRTFGICS